MKYKDLMGFSSPKKKITKKQPKPKVNEVIKSVNEEFGFVNETLPSLGREYTNFKKAEKLYIKSINDLARKAGKVEKVYDKQISYSFKKLISKPMMKFKDALDDVLGKLQ